MVLIKKSALLLCLLAIISGCASGRSAFNKGEKFERNGKLDEAVVKYAEAAAANPDVGEYRLRLLKASEKSARQHFNKGEEFFAAKNYDDALREYQSAFTLDPSFDRAKQMSDKTGKIRNSLFYYNEGIALEKDRKPREAIRSYQRALEFNSDNKEAKEAVERLLKSRKTRLDGTELNLKSNKPITLKFKDAKIKEVFNILSQLSGINFIFDEGLKDQNVSIYLENATFQQALDILTGINKLSKKILNESTIIVYPKNPEKTKQYEELYVQTFFLNKLEAKKAVNLIRTMIQVKKIYVNEDMNALVIRDSPEVIEVAQKILDANDVPDAELVLEVEVMEVSKNNRSCRKRLLVVSLGLAADGDQPVNNGSHHHNNRHYAGQSSAAFQLEKLRRFPHRSQCDVQFRQDAEQQRDTCQSPTSGEEPRKSKVQRWAAGADHHDFIADNRGHQRQCAVRGCRGQAQRGTCRPVEQRNNDENQPRSQYHNQQANRWHRSGDYGCDHRHPESRHGPEPKGRRDQHYRRTYPGRQGQQQTEGLSSWRHPPYRTAILG